MDQFYYFLRRILFTVIANPSCPFAFNASFIMLYIVLFCLIKSIYDMQIKFKILGDKIFHCVLGISFPIKKVQNKSNICSVPLLILLQILIETFCTVIFTVYGLFSDLYFLSYTVIPPRMVISTFVVLISSGCIL